MLNLGCTEPSWQDAGCVQYMLLLSAQWERFTGAVRQSMETCHADSTHVS